MCCLEPTSSLGGISSLRPSPPAFIPPDLDSTQVYLDGDSAVSVSGGDVCVCWPGFQDFPGSACPPGGRGTGVGPGCAAAYVRSWDPAAASGELALPFLLPLCPVHLTGLLC